MQEFLLLAQFDRINATPIEWTRLKLIITKAYDEASEWAERLELATQDRTRAPSGSAPTISKEVPSTVTAAEIRQFMRALRTLERSIHEDEAQLANGLALLLIGEAGSGKTHLFCDVGHIDTSKADYLAARRKVS